MRNLGGAIGLALIDTVLFGRAPIHAEQIGQRLKLGAVSVAPLVGLDPEAVANAPHRTIDAATIEFVRPLVERAGLVSAINDAWAMLAAIAALSLLALPFVVSSKRQ
ncbi:MAG: hypothetical protein ACREUF_13425 [Solimonas sp.]